jgi:hydrogenase-4 component F
MTALPVALVAVPALGAAGAAVRSQGRSRSAWLLAIAALHSGLVAWGWLDPSARMAPGAVLGLDGLGLTAVSVVSLVFLAVAAWCVGYLRQESPRGGRWFATCLLAFLASASVVSVSRHLGLLWVGMEATTLSIAPLVFDGHDRRSLEAVWKYLVLSSVGIAFALLGTFLVATAQSNGVMPGRSLMIDDLVAPGAGLDTAWLRGAFVFLLVGYGTKMGIAPLHTWKPDVYGEAPSFVGGLMAGALTTVAFVGLSRATQVTVSAGQESFVRPLLIGAALVSLGVATAFLLIGQRDLKRLLAYSSVEQMGILVLGLGLGGAGAFGAVLHAVNSGLSKTFAFLVVGNIVLATGDATIAGNRGLLHRRPLSGVLLLLGLVAITGAPPFGPFISEIIILRAAVDGGHPGLAIGVAVLLGLAFVGMARSVLDVLYAAPPTDGAEDRVRPGVWLLAGPVGLAALVTLLGVYLPGPLQDALAEAAQALGGALP